ncbi:F0F1 ATP synthase subunit B [Mucilaginibacter flavus]|jgi:F-type H+-transporting ATPase subunit b|uniref:F0F1 ATP synthase subunit B n=1 Tax=Mucilaginibacter flavus TaxID=931504 RepID=UPI0025B56017|nr:F0F1 ATP synthase subunit B [Mucilaginibacter flavus]MDN3584143.1 F0F1 ATP synthase subunit B [Mucilaginibacter flavus]
MNPLVTPDLGLVVWTTVAFAFLFFILAKFAWKPIMAAIGDREASIEKALLKAEAAKEEMERLVRENDSLIKQARAERDQILSDAKKVKEQMISDAKELAHKEGARMIELARVEINNQKAVAMADVKNQVATLSIQIAEKILQGQLEDQKKQDELVSQLLKEVKL